MIFTRSATPIETIYVCMVSIVADLIHQLLFRRPFQIMIDDLTSIFLLHTQATLMANGT